MLSVTALISSRCGISWGLHPQIMLFGEVTCRFGCLLMVEIIVACLLPIPLGGLSFPLLCGIYGKVEISLFSTCKGRNSKLAREILNQAMEFIHCVATPRASMCRR